MEMPTEDRAKSCGQCNLSFKMTKDLKMHMIQHEGKKSHSCNQCGYSSTLTANLKRHMLVHSGEKPFVCKQCNYSCTSAGSLKKHIRTHSGVKPFTCTQCFFFFFIGQMGLGTHTLSSTQKSFNFTVETRLQINITSQVLLGELKKIDT